MLRVKGPSLAPQFFNTRYVFILIVILLSTVKCKFEEAVVENNSERFGYYVEGVNTVASIKQLSKFSALAGTSFTLKAKIENKSISFAKLHKLFSLSVPATYSISPDLPPSMSFSTITGEISGNIPNNFSEIFTVTASFSDGRTLFATIQITSSGYVNDFSLGPTHSCALVNSDLYCSGFNGYGKLGLGNNFSTSGIYESMALENVSKVYAGRNHSCALKVDGAVWCWGLNNYGQLGNNSTDNSIAPVEATEFGNGNIAISLTQYNTCVLHSDGSIACVGQGAAGRLGNGADADSQIAVDVVGLSNVIDIKAGDYHTCALKSDSTLWCWGTNFYGQLGQNHSLASNVPVQMKDETGAGFFTQITDFDAGGYHTCLVNAGKAYCTGLNTYGQLGNGTKVTTILPVQVSGLSTQVSKIATGDYHSCAIDNQNLYCWGMNNVGQLGDGTNNQSDVPVAVNNLSGPVTEVWATGNVNPAVSSVSCARDSVNIKCWGANQYSQISALESSYVDPNVQAGLPGLPSSISVQGRTLCTVVSGEVYCKGLNDYSQIGTGTSSRYNSNFVKVNGIAGASNVVAGRYMVCSVTRDNKLYCWGYGGMGNLGVGNTLSSATPVETAIANVETVAVGLHSACALKTDKSLWCFGGNYNGQIGDGSFTQSNLPVQVLADVKMVDSGNSLVCAAKTDNSVWCWGQGEYGALGDGSQSNSSSPVQVSGLPNATLQKLSVSAFGACAIMNSKLYCWGRDAFSWSGGSGDSATAVAVLPKKSFSEVKMQKNQWGGCAQATNNQFFCFGNNYSKNFESELVDVINTPTQSNKFANNVSDFAIGESTTCYLDAASSITCWGFNHFGQAKDSTTGFLLDKTVPGPFEVR